MSSTIDEIKARIDLVDLIGRVVQLRRSGSSFKGLCPFHQEKSPSFYVFTNTNSYHCFGCGKSGTALDWMMEREHLEFGEALRSLAQMAGVSLPEQRDIRQSDQAERLRDLLAKAQTYYQALLVGTAGNEARQYLERRAVSDRMVSAFGLGYAGTGNGLLRYLQEHGASDEDLDASGIISTADDGRRYDFFRDRVIFPIRDAQGHTIAFGGRALSDQVQPKYLNSRDTLLFHKQETLFALDLARKSIGQQRQAVVVEGYMDALRAHQHAFTNVVAALGTAITDRQLGLLRRVADEVVLALDSDAAGQAATWRTLQNAERGLQQGLRPVPGANRRRLTYVPDRTVQLKVVTLPGAKDPDDLIRADPDAWPALMSGALPVVEFAIRQLPARHDLSTGSGKSAAAAEIVEILANIGDPIQQSHYVQQVAATLKVDEGSVRQAIRRHRRNGPSHSPPTEKSDREAEQGGTSNARPTVAEKEVRDTLDEYALALVLYLGYASPDGLSDAERTETSLHLVQPRSRALWRQIEQRTADASAIDAFRSLLDDELRPLLDHVAAHVAMLSRLTRKDAHEELRLTHRRMTQRALVTRLAQVRALLRDAEDATERARWRDELTSVARSLDELDGQLATLPPRLAEVGGA